MSKNGSSAPQPASPPVSALEATQARLRAENVEAHEAGEADVVQRIHAALQDLANQFADQITVRVDEDEVTLTGMLPSGLERHAAERAARSAPGVKVVHNRIMLGV